MPRAATSNVDLSQAGCKTGRCTSYPLYHENQAPLTKLAPIIFRYLDGDQSFPGFAGVYLGD